MLSAIRPESWSTYVCYNVVHTYILDRQYFITTIPTVMPVIFYYRQYITGGHQYLAQNENARRKSYIYRTIIILSGHAEGRSVITGLLSAQTAVPLHVQPCARAVVTPSSCFSRLLGSVTWCSGRFFSSVAPQTLLSPPPMCVLAFNMVHTSWMGRSWRQQGGFRSLGQTGHLHFREVPVSVLHSVMWPGQARRVYRPCCAWSRWRGSGASLRTLSDTFIRLGHLRFYRNTA